MIKVYEIGTLERKRFGDVATVLHDITGGDFTVEDVYFDFGQGWKWTTIVCTDVDYQILNPVQHKAIIEGVEDEVLDEIIGAYFRLKAMDLRNLLTRFQEPDRETDGRVFNEMAKASRKLKREKITERLNALKEKHDAWKGAK